MTDPTAAGTARILDRGYRPYDGPRSGVRGAVRSLTTHSMQRALGLKRTAWAKVLPALTVFIAYVPAIVFVGLTIMAKQVIDRNPDVLPSYPAYYGYVIAAIFVFTAFVAPELLCTDRRTGMLGLYLASPLTRNTYLLAKAFAVTSILALVTLGPPLFMLVARTIAGSGPDGPAALALLFARVVLAGVAVAVLYTALSLAVSSVTTRRAAASAAIIFILIGTSVVSDALIHGADAPAALFLIDLLNLPPELVYRIYGASSGLASAGSLSTAAIVGAYVAWTTALGLFTWLRYRRLAVSR